MKRRLFTAALLTTPWRAQAQFDDLAARLRAGGCAVLLRHAQTDPGVGDPPGFRLNQCSSQRNLSDEGRAQSARIGQWFMTRGLQPGAIRSSAWCRCQDTADLAFGRHAVWPALNSFFGVADSRGAQTAALRAELTRIAAGQFEVWVTHQVNITALTGEGMAMGEALIVDTRGKMVARSTFS
jgi:hypothetical protein